jgi:hypothetical protein
MIPALQDLLERFVFDPSVIDLVVWYPHLTWGEFLVSTLTVLVWRFVTERIERLLAYHARRVLAWLLFRLAVAVKPRRV